MKKKDKFYVSLIFFIVIFAWVRTYEIEAESLWAKGSKESLFTDHKAKKAGDIITVLVLESAQAMQKSSTKKSKDAEISGGPTAVEKGKKNLFDFIPYIGAKGNSKYKGDADTSRSGILKANVTAQVVRVLPNGNLAIEGNKKLLINNEEQLLTVSGVIRPEDIEADNSILSTYILDASIKYKGSTSLSDKERPGIITRVFTRIANILF
ncbi:MAG: flagellar basal body L-ring protein FlgH [bacterium]|nr:flagellar basal body L-ring protein FlgH [bacterium]